MTDKAQRDLMLRWFYDQRSGDAARSIPVRFEDAEAESCARACEQLKELDLIKWGPDRRCIDGQIKIIGGKGRITVHGVNEIEVDHDSDAPVVNDNRIHVNISHASGFQVGHTNSQQIDSITISQLARLIDEADAKKEEKAEVKNLLTRVLEHPLVANIIAGAIKVAAT
jgi:hypothetical protein